LVVEKKGEGVGDQREEGMWLGFPLGGGAKVKGGNQSLLRRKKLRVGPSYFIDS